MIKKLTLTFAWLDNIFDSILLYSYLQFLLCEMGSGYKVTQLCWGDFAVNFPHCKTASGMKM